MNVVSEKAAAIVTGESATTGTRKEETVIATEAEEDRGIKVRSANPSKGDHQAPSGPLT